MTDFRLSWRFTDERYHKLPDQHLEQLIPLDEDASGFLWDYISKSGLHHGTPFRQDFFRTIDSTRVTIGGEEEVRKWLHRRGLPFSKRVFLSWQPTDAMIVPWEIVVEYFDAFYYSGADDLTVIDESLMWALLFHHDDEVYFGTNGDYPLTEYR